MAAPASKTVGNLNGKWVLNKTLSDPTDPALSLQGVGWLIRKAIGAATVTVAVKQYVDDSGTTHIDAEQTASGLKGTSELRTLDWQPREHSDWLFGRVEGRSKFITAEELTAFLQEALSQKWAVDDFLAQDWIEDENEKKGPKGEPYVLNHVKADRGWFATQVWGFQMIGDERRYVRNVVVAKEDKFENFKMIYDFVSE
ncbi:hypothetical protein HD806DRAFT_87908 [Xylariaceae sp. AK1471]|nr:hypothetical protein HD806DRAFT_87908 [Xylariaceae sp. AK1471]